MEPIKTVKTYTTLYTIRLYENVSETLITCPFSMVPNLHVGSQKTRSTSKNHLSATVFTSITNSLALISQLECLHIRTYI